MEKHGLKKCPYCGEENVSGAKYCMICYNPMDGSAARPVYQGEQSPEREQQPRTAPSAQPAAPPAQSQGAQGVQRAQGYKYAPTGQDPAHPLPPPNYLPWAILATIFCCQIFGIVAIVMAVGVNSEYRQGNYERAAKLSRQAGTWTLVTFITGLVYILFYVVGMAFGGF